MIALVVWIAVAGCTITGTPGDDAIRGTPRADVICAGAGNDLIWAWDGTRDWIDGGAGSDRAWLDVFDRVFAVERHG